MAIRLPPGVVLPPAVVIRLSTLSKTLPVYTRMVVPTDGSRVSVPPPLSVVGSTTLSGGGTLTLDPSVGTTMRVYTGNVFDNVDNLITTAGGSTTPGGSLIAIGSYATFINESGGTIDDTDQVLQISGGGTLVNDGTIDSSGAG